MIAGVEGVQRSLGVVRLAIFRDLDAISDAYLHFPVRGLEIELGTSLVDARYRLEVRY